MCSSIRWRQSADQILFDFNLAWLKGFQSVFVKKEKKSVSILEGLTKADGNCCKLSFKTPKEEEDEDAVASRLRNLTNDSRGKQ